MENMTTEQEIEELEQRLVGITITGYVNVPLQSRPGTCAQFGPHDDKHLPSQATFRKLVNDTHERKD